MGTQRNGAAQRRAAAVTPNAIQAYLDRLTAKGRGASTVKNYSNKLTMFYQELPEGKQVTEQVLLDWRQSLLERGYSPNTVNTYLTAVNGLLDHIGRRDLQLVDRLELDPSVQPELTRAEYLRLLGAAKVLERERTYLLVKLFALTGIRVGDVAGLSAWSVERGQVQGTDNSGRAHGIPLPACLQEELRDYLRRTGTAAGPVFVTRNGRPLRRTQISKEIRDLSKPAQVAEGKCNPQCLRKLYQATQEHIEANVRLLVRQAQDQLLEQEQMAIGWAGIGLSG